MMNFPQRISGATHYFERLGFGWVSIAALLLAFSSGAAWGAELGLTIEGRPIHPILANGQSVAHVPILVLDEVGSLLLTEAEISGRADIGEVLDAWSAGPGIYLVSYRPPIVQRPEVATLTLTCKQGNRVGTGEVKVDLRPAGWGTVEIQSRPTPIILGQDPGARIDFIPRDLNGQLHPARNLIVDSSKGALGPLTDLDGGGFSAAFQLPQENWPQVAIVTAVDPDDFETNYGFFVLPLVGTTRFPVQAEPGVQLSFAIGERQFGPVVTGPEGYAQVELLVEPGDTIARVTSVDVEGNTQEEMLDLSPPPSRRVALIAPPVGLPGDGKSTFPLRMLIIHEDGRGMEGAGVSLEAEMGTVSQIVDRGAGLYEASYTPPLSLEASKEDTLTAHFWGVASNNDGAEGADKKSVSKHSVKVRILPPEQVSLPGMKGKPAVSSDKPFADWMSLTTSKEHVNSNEASTLKVEVRGFNGEGAAPLNPELQVIASAGTLSPLTLTSEGLLVSELTLPPLKDGASVAVIVVDPQDRRSTWSLIYAGDSPTRSLPGDVGPAIRESYAEKPPEEVASVDEKIAVEVAQTGNTKASSIETTEGETVEDPSEVVLAPPPKALRVRGTRLYPLYAVGSYQFKQESTTPDSVVADGYGIQAFTLFGMGLGMDHWLRSHVGISGRYLVGNYGFDPGDRLLVPGAVSSFYHVGTVDLRFRTLTPIEGGAVSFGLRLGGARTTHPFFEEQSDGVAYLDNNVLWLARGGLDFDALLKEHFEVRVSYDLGVDPDTLAPTSHHGELGLGYRIKENISIGVTGEGWQRTINAYAEGEQVGVLTDQWLFAWLFVAVHY